MRVSTSSDAPAAASMITRWPPGLLLAGWVAVALGIGTHDGRYALPSLALVVIGTLLVAAGVATSNGPFRVGPVSWAKAWTGPTWLPQTALAGAALTVGFAPVVWHPRYFAHGAGWTVSQVLAAAGGLLAAATVLPAWGFPPRLAGRHWPFWTALGLMSAAGVTMIAAAPNPHIDVFFLLQGSTKGLVSGADMYRQHWDATRQSYFSHGLYDVYPYLPWTSVLLLPFRLIFGDIRYGLVAALAVAAWCARGLAGDRRGPAARFMPALLPLLVALYPKATLADQLSWTEPLLVALLAGMVLAVERGKGAVATCCLMLALASKQHIVLLLPLAALWPRFGWRRTLAAAAGALVLVSPWIIAGPRDFWHDVVDANVGLGYRADALCIPTFLHKVFGHDPGFALTALGLLAAYAVAWRVRGDAFGFCAGAGLLVLALDITNTQSFFNHYTLGMSLVALAVVLRTTTVGRAGQRLVENRTRFDDSSSGRRPT